MDKDWMAEQKRAFYKLDDIIELLEAHRAERIKVRYQNGSNKTHPYNILENISQREPVHQRRRLLGGRISEEEKMGFQG